MAALTRLHEWLKIGWRRVRRAHPLDERTWQLHRLLRATADPDARRTLAEEIAHVLAWRDADLRAAKEAAQRARRAYLDERWHDTPMWIRLVALLVLPVAGVLLATSVSGPGTTVVAQRLTATTGSRSTATTDPGESTAPTVLGTVETAPAEGTSTVPATPSRSPRPRPVLGLPWPFTATTTPAATSGQPPGSATGPPTVSTLGPRPPRPRPTTTTTQPTTTTEEPTTTTEEPTTTTTEEPTTTTTEEPTTTTETP